EYLSVLKTLEYGSASADTDRDERVISVYVSNGCTTSEVAYATISFDSTSGNNGGDDSDDDSEDDPDGDTDDDTYETKEIVLNEDGTDEISIDLDTGSLKINGVEVPLDDANYSHVNFQNILPTNKLQLVLPQLGFGDSEPGSGESGGTNRNALILGGGGSEIDWSKYNLPQIDTSLFTHIQYVIRDEATVVNLNGTDGNDIFFFQDEIVTFTTSDEKIYTVTGGKIFVVDGVAGSNRAVIYDTPEQDCVIFEDGKVTFTGGKNTKLAISIYGFTSVDVVSYYGGGDKAVFVNGDSNEVILDERLSHWYEVRTVNDAENLDRTSARNIQWFTAKGFNETIVVCSESKENKVFLNGGAGQNYILVQPDFVTATNEFNTFKHSIIGNAIIELCGDVFAKSSPNVYYQGVDAENGPLSFNLLVKGGNHVENVAVEKEEFLNSDAGELSANEQPDLSGANAGFNNEQNHADSSSGNVNNEANSSFTQLPSTENWRPLGKVIIPDLIFIELYYESVLNEREPYNTSDSNFNTYLESKESRKSPGINEFELGLEYEQSEKKETGKANDKINDVLANFT
ncbi:MAG: hypothetical protein ACRC2T_06415, partial [Thermoguttaceae bacterium]